MQADFFCFEKAKTIYTYISPLNTLAQRVPKRRDTIKVQTILYNVDKVQKQKERWKQTKQLSVSRLKDSAAIFDNQNQN